MNKKLVIWPGCNLSRAAQLAAYYAGTENAQRTGYRSITLYQYDDSEGYCVYSTATSIVVRRDYEPGEQRITAVLP